MRDIGHGAPTGKVYISDFGLQISDLMKGDESDQFPQINTNPQSAI